MSDTARPLTTPTLLSAAASLVAALGFIAFMLIGSVPQALSSVMRSIVPILAVTLLALSMMIWWSRLHDGRRTGWPVVVALVAVTASLSVLFAWSFEAGMDDGDAGRPIGFFGGLTWWFALAGVVSAGTTVALLMRVLLGGGERLIPVVVGVTSAVPLFFALMQPTVPVLVSLSALMVLVVQSVRRLQAEQTVADTREPDVAFAAVPSRSRVMGVIALAVVPVVWGVAGLVGIAEAGRPAATQSMGYGLALSQLAAIPLLLAIRGSVPLDVHRYLAVPVIGVGLGVAVQIVWWAPTGTAMYVGSAVTGVTIGCWLALVTLPLLPATTAMNVVVGFGIVAASATAWFVVVTMTAGIGLVIAAIVAVTLAPRRVSRRVR